MFAWLLIHPIALLCLHYLVFQKLDVGESAHWFALIVTAAVSFGITVGCAEQLSHTTDKETSKAAAMVAVNSLIALLLPGGEPSYGIAVPALALNAIVMLFIVAKN